MGSKKAKKKVKLKKRGTLVKTKKYRLNGKNHCSDIDECQSLESFSQVRENYFTYLQNVIKENLESIENENFSKDTLERISLEVEQQALLACMQTDIYQRIMIKIIHDIRKSTQKLKLHLGIRNVITSKNIEASGVLSQLRVGESGGIYVTEKESCTEVYSHIPTISNIRPDYNEYDHEWPSQNIATNSYQLHVTSDNDFSGEDGLAPQENINKSCEAQDLMEPVYPLVDEHYLTVYNGNSSEFTSSSVNGLDQPVNSNVLVPCEEEDRTFYSQNLVSLAPTSSRECMVNDELDELHEAQSLHGSEVTTRNDVEGDPISKSRNQLQKSVEKSLKTLKEIKVQKKEEIERAQLVKLLEDDCDDEIEDNQYDSLSDNCDETAETNENDERNDSLLADRLEEMRQIFGVEDEAEEKVVKNNENNSEFVKLQKPPHHRKIHKSSSMWYHERVIQMHKLSLLASEMTVDMRNVNRDLFLKYFGEDSDEENEINFQREDKYLTSCKERISSWVVKYLMPFYHKKRIIGRNVFKSLGHHVSNSIIERIQYPDEWTVKYLVTKFFPNDKMFLDINDVFNFQIE